MLSKSFTLLFYLKKRSNYVKGKLPIYMRLTIDGKRIELAVKRECEPEKWNSVPGRKSGTKEEVRVLNAYLVRCNSGFMKYTGSSLIQIQK